MSTVEAPPKIERAKRQSRAMLAVLLCTFINAASQALIKLGTATLGLHPNILETAVGIATKPLLFAGYSLLGVSTILFVLALRNGDLSLLYPVLTLGYVWVTVLSVAMSPSATSSVRQLRLNHGLPSALSNSTIHCQPPGTGPESVSTCPI